MATAVCAWAQKPKEIGRRDACAPMTEKEVAKAFDEIENLMKEGSYSSAYERGEALWRRNPSLRVAWCMERAALQYREDAADSAYARYLRLLPTLDTVERAVCMLLIDSAEGQRPQQDTAISSAKKRKRSGETKRRDTAGREAKLRAKQGRRHATLRTRKRTLHARAGHDTPKDEGRQRSEKT